MAYSISDTRRGASRAIAVCALVAALVASATAAVYAQAGKTPPGPSGPLVGTWLVQVTLRDCTTDAALGVPFHSLVSFHAGGTVSESASPPGFAIGQRTPALGTWRPANRLVYRQHMVALIVFDTRPNLPVLPDFDPDRPVTPGFSAGLQTVTVTMRLRNSRSLTSRGTNAFYRLDEDEPYLTGCSSAVGVRVG